MDFLDLLESFGLDMKSVAQALGIDEATLNNMDKDVLLHLLTSQTANANWNFKEKSGKNLNYIEVSAQHNSTLFDHIVEEDR